MQKIFIFGDSIAYGAWDPVGGWVERLRQWLFMTTQGEYNLGTFLYNLSIVGDTTADLLKRFTPEIEARQPGILSFLPPASTMPSSSTAGRWRRPLHVCTNVRMLIQRARAYASLLCWVGLTPVDDARTTPIPWMPDRAYRNATVAGVRGGDPTDGCRRSNPHIDLFSAWTADRAYRHLLVDGIHPNAAGHAQICERIKAFLQRHGLET